MLAELHQPNMYHKATLTRRVVGQYILRVIQTIGFYGLTLSLLGKQPMNELLASCDSLDS